MRTSRSLTCWVLAILLTQTTGCFSWHGLDKQDLTAGRLEKTKRLRVETTDGYEWEVRDPTVRDSLLVGRIPLWDQETYREFPISGLRVVEERHFSWWRTGAVAGAAYLTVMALVYATLVGTGNLLLDEIKGG